MPDLDELRSRVPPAIVEVLERALGFGFLGPVAIADQIDHALGFVLAAERDRTGGPGTALDLGSGGGLPGLVLGACWPECRLTLLEAGERRASFLEQEVAGLPRLAQVTVARGRAEALAREDGLRQRFDVVTSRSFGPPPVTAECGAPFVAVGGCMVVSEPPAGEGSERWPLDGLALVGLADGGPFRSEAGYSYRLLSKTVDTPGRYPRRTGIPAKRPLF